MEFNLEDLFGDINSESLDTSLKISEERCNEILEHILTHLRELKNQSKASILKKALACCKNVNEAVFVTFVIASKIKEIDLKQKHDIQDEQNDAEDFDPFETFNFSKDAK